MNAVVDRVVQYPHRYQLKNVGTGELLGTFDLEPITGTISVVGTKIDKELFDSIASDISARLVSNGGDLKDTIITFSMASTRSNVASDEKLNVSFGKIAKYFNDLKAVAFSGNKKDIGLSNVDNTSDKDKPISTAQQQGLNKPLYNLGAFDTVSGNVITRKTTGCYVCTGTESWTFYNGFWYTGISGLIETKSLLCGNGINAICYVNNQIRVYLSSNPCITSSTDMNSVFTNGVIIQHELENSYTEEIIEGQPLITLDSQGSQWLRDEWEKGINLYSGQKNVSGQDTKVVFSPKLQIYNNDTLLKSYGSTDVNTVNKLVLFTFTKSSNCNKLRFGHNGSENDVVTTYNISTLSNENYTLSFLVTGYKETKSFTNIMLNKGSHAYPYQEYNGGIVRQKQLDDKANKSDVFTKDETQALIDSVTTGEVELTNYYTKNETENKLANKVDKVSGKGLSTNDFTNELKSKLESLSNYDDTNIKNEITSIKNRLDTIEANIVFMGSRNVSGRTSTIGDGTGYFYSNSFSIGSSYKVVSASFSSKVGANNDSYITYSGNTISFTLYTSSSNQKVSATIEYVYKIL